MNGSQIEPLSQRPSLPRSARLRAKLAFRLLWAGAIVMVMLGSFLPGSSWLMKLADRLVLSDSIRHWTGYAVVTGLPLFYENGKFRVRIAVGAFLMGVLIEILQGATGRDFEFSDICWNGCGVASGVLGVLGVRRWLKHPAAPPPL
ncbi:MAG: hypothetical protein ABI824_08945 [Acidobacteriota bacterium]